jgi:hypothetical protein
MTGWRGAAFTIVEPIATAETVDARKEREVRTAHEVRPLRAAPVAGGLRQ